MNKKFNDDNMKELRYYLWGSCNDLTMSLMEHDFGIDSEESLEVEERLEQLYDLVQCQCCSYWEDTSECTTMTGEWICNDCFEQEISEREE